MRRAGVGLVLAGVALGALGVASVAGVKVFDFSPARPQAGQPAGGNVSGMTTGSEQKFNYLAAQNSNFCGLQADTVMGYPDSTQIQGACCNPLDLGTYRSQVEGLRAFSTESAIPADPYDINAGIAKRLLGYDRSITLDPAEQIVFDQAMSRTPDKAPCCCKCWRWYAHQGLAKYLIHDRHFDAQTVGKVVILVNGCGGRRDLSSQGSPDTG